MTRGVAAGTELRSKATRSGQKGQEGRVGSRAALRQEIGGPLIVVVDGGSKRDFGFAVAEVQKWESR